MKSFIAVLFAIDVLSYQTSAQRSKCCSCAKFTGEQENQLKKLLKEEAAFLREGMQMMCPKKASKWHRVTNMTDPRDRVCFYTKGNKPGKFNINREGFVAAFKLVHVGGKVSCESANCHSSHSGASFDSKWGCSTSHPYVGSTPLGTFITTASKRILFPREKFIRDKSMPMWYALPGFGPDSPFLVFHDFANPEFFHKGQELQLWFGKDLKEENNSRDSIASDNSDPTCVEVYVWYL